jgi:hypothetical protein
LTKLSQITLFQRLNIAQFPVKVKYFIEAVNKKAGVKTPAFNLPRPVKLVWVLAKLIF